MMTGSFANDYPGGLQYGYFIIEVIGDASGYGIVQRATATRQSSAIPNLTYQRTYNSTVGWSSWKLISMQ